MGGERAKGERGRRTVTPGQRTRAIPDRTAGWADLALATAVVVPLAAGAALVSGAAAAVVGAAAATAAVGVLVHRSERRIRRRVAAERAVVVNTLDRRTRELYGQLEALASLYAVLRLDHPLPATDHWTIEPDLLVEIVRHVRRPTPIEVLELGSGTSTVVIAACLRRGGGGHLLSLEHDPSFAERTRRELDAQGLEAFATVVDAPLVPVTLGAEQWRWYDLSGLPDDRPVDVLVVDGPPTTTGPLARYPALPLLRPRLAPGAVILVDDMGRDEDRAMVQRWLREDPELVAAPLNVRKGATVIARR